MRTIAIDIVTFHLSLYRAVSAHWFRTGDLAAGLLQLHVDIVAADYIARLVLTFGFSCL